MKVNVSFQNFKKTHIKKKSQVVYAEKRCLDYAKIENLYNLILSKKK